ncbi:TPA: hypothetical protein DIV55_00460 [Patescibacteria group bacterium]|nr:hypothetical protein [Patescibacteria group bacterium]
MPQAFEVNPHSFVPQAGAAGQTQVLLLQTSPAEHLEVSFEVHWTQVLFEQIAVVPHPPQLADLPHALVTVPHLPLQEGVGQQSPPQVEPP